MIHSIAQCVSYLTKGIFEVAFFSQPTTKALSGVLGRYESGHTCITYIAKSKSKSQGDASHTLWSRHAYLGWWDALEPLDQTDFDLRWILDLNGDGRPMFKASHDGALAQVGRLPPVAFWPKFRWIAFSCSLESSQVGSHIEYAF
jgi:hypothetical protein